MRKPASPEPGQALLDIGVGGHGQHGLSDLLDVVVADLDAVDVPDHLEQSPLAEG